MIKKFLKKFLPNQILNYLLKINSKWNSMIVLDKKLIKRIAEYFDLNNKQVICLLTIGTRLNKEFWGAINPKTEQEIKHFYKILPFYTFSLAYWHMQKSTKKFRRKVIELCGEDVLDYGGGIGDLSISLAKNGVDVTYSDVCGKTSEFAKWLFKKEECLNIKTFDVEGDRNKIWSKKYDTIICIDVIEHIPHPENVLKKMAEALKNDGKLIITALNCLGPKNDAPMHLKINFDVKKLLNSSNVFKSKQYDWLWIKKL